jgi:hypothetical protein
MARVTSSGVADCARVSPVRIAASGSFAHRQDGPYGENLWSGTAGRFSMTSVVDAWGSEQANYNMNAKRCAPGKVCGHFTQVVWWNTTTLGCDKATGTNGNDVVVCNYDPPGNVTGESPFGKEPQSHRF